MIGLKIFCLLPSLTMADVVQGVVGELLGIEIWGRLGREGSRKIQRGVGGYLLLHYSVCLGLLILNETARYVNKLGLSCAKLSLASAKLHTSLSSDQLKLATN